MEHIEPASLAFEREVPGPFHCSAAGEAQAFRTYLNDVQATKLRRGDSSNDKEPATNC